MNTVKQNKQYDKNITTLFSEDGVLFCTKENVILEQDYPQKEKIINNTESAISPININQSNKIIFYRT